MSQQNVEPLHGAIDAFNHATSMPSWRRKTPAARSPLTAELHDVRALGDKTFARGRLYGTGAGSGAAFERTLWLAHEWRHDKTVWWHAFESEAEALEAAGMSE